MFFGFEGLFFVEEEVGSEFVVLLFEWGVFEWVLLYLAEEVVALLNLVLDELVFLLVVGLELVLLKVDRLDLCLEALVHGFEGVVLSLEQWVGFEEFAELVSQLG